MLNQLPPTIVEFIDGVNAFDIGRIRRLSPMTLWLATITANSGANRQSVGTDDHWLCCLVTSVAYCHSSLAIAASRTSGEASATMGLPRRWRNLPGVM